MIQAGENVSILGSVGIALIRSMEFHTPETTSSHPRRQNTADYEDLDDSSKEEKKLAQKIWKRLLQTEMMLIYFVRQLILLMELILAQKETPFEFFSKHWIEAEAPSAKRIILVC